MPNTNPYFVVADLEERVSDWAGSRYAVATDSGTSAIFLSLMYRKYTRGSIGEVSMPKYSYPSVPCSIIHAGGKVKFTDETWQGQYELKPLRIWDSALRFRKGMYDESMKVLGALQCASLHVKKILPVGRGGLIFTDDFEAAKWLRKARFDGRNPVPLLEDNFDMLGWNCYLTPEQGARAIQLFELIRNKDMQDLKVEDQGYPNLDLFPIYKK